MEGHLREVGLGCFEEVKFGVVLDFGYMEY